MKNNYLIQEHQKNNYQIKLDYNSVCDLLFKKAEENPNKIFLICPGEKHEEFTYSEFKTIVKPQESPAKYKIKNSEELWKIRDILSFFFKPLLIRN